LKKLLYHFKNYVAANLTLQKLTHMVKHISDFERLFKVIYLIQCDTYEFSMNLQLKSFCPTNISMNSPLNKILRALGNTRTWL